MQAKTIWGWNLIFFRHYRPKGTAFLLYDRFQSMHQALEHRPHVVDGIEIVCCRFDPVKFLVFLVLAN